MYVRVSCEHSESIYIQIDYNQLKAHMNVQHSKYLFNCVFSGWIVDITDNYNLPYYIFGSTNCLAGIIILLIPIVQEYTDT